MSETPKTKTTAKERAQAQVGVLERRLQKLNTKKAQLEREARDLGPEIGEVKALLDHAQASPLLKEPTSTAKASGGSVSVSGSDGVLINDPAPVDQEGTR